MVYSIRFTKFQIEKNQPELELILLTRAEAGFEINPVTATALGDINAIRGRAGIIKLKSLTLEAIRHKRRIESAFEGIRFYAPRR